MEVRVGSFTENAGHGQLEPAVKVLRVTRQIGCSILALALLVEVTAAAKVAPDADRLRDAIHQSYAALHKAISADIVNFESSKMTDQVVDTQMENVKKPAGITFTDQVA